MSLIMFYISCSQVLINISWCSLEIANDRQFFLPPTPPPCPFYIALQPVTIFSPPQPTAKSNLKTIIIVSKYFKNEIPRNHDNAKIIVNFEIVIPDSNIVFYDLTDLVNCYGYSVSFLQTVGQLCVFATR